MNEQRSAPAGRSQWRPAAAGRRLGRRVGLAGAVLLLAACGGGDGGEAPAPPPGQLEFNMDAAFGRLLARGGSFENLKWSAGDLVITRSFGYSPQPPDAQGVVTSAVRTATTVSSAWPQPTSAQETYFFSLSPTRIHATATTGAGLMRWVAASDLPTAGHVGTGGLYATVESTVTVRVWWSLEAADAQTAWACLAVASDRAGAKECFRIDPAGTIHAAKLTEWSIGDQRTYQ